MRDIAFNDKWMSELPFRCEIVDYHVEFPSVEKESVTLAGRHGRRPMFKRFDTKMIHLTLHVPMVSERLEWAETRDTLSAWLPFYEDVTITYDDTERYDIGHVESVEIVDEFRPTLLFNVTINAEPYSQTDWIKSSESMVNYKGNIPSPLRFFVNGGGTVTVSSKHGKRTDKIVVENVSGYIEIDGWNKEVRVNHELVVLEVSGRFPELKHGTNEIKIEGATGEYWYKELYK